MAEQLGKGKLRKMVTRHESTVGYDMPLGEAGSLQFNINWLYEDENVYYYNDDIGEEFDATAFLVELGAARI